MLTLEDSVRKEWDALRSRGLTNARAQEQLIPSSIREDDRSFGCVAASETPARMIDWDAMAYIDEVLVARGAEFAVHVPLLRNHRRFDTDDVFGSAREWKLEDEAQVACRGFLSDPADPQDPVARAWMRVRGGHLRAVSVGYEVLEFEDIPAGERKKVAGRFWTAKDRRLRISTRWRVHELSLTPIGADPKALIRSKGPDPVAVSYFRTSGPQPVGSYFR